MAVFQKAMDILLMLGSPTMCQSLQNLLDLLHEYTSRYMFEQKSDCAVCKYFKLLRQKNEVADAPEEHL